MASENREGPYTDGENQDEESSPNSGQETKRFGNIRKDLDSEVEPRKTHLVLILLFFITGLVDSAAYNVFNCFVSMQTGNTVFVGLGASAQPVSAPPFAWTKSLVAILCYMLGSLCFSTFHRTLGPAKKKSLTISFLFQALMTLAVAILVTTKVVSHGVVEHKLNIEGGTTAVTLFRRINWEDLVPISLLAFQAAGQVVASRVLHHNDLPTAVVTSMLCDLMSDIHLLSGGLLQDSSRNRRSAAAILLLLGAITGGALTKSWVGLAGVLYLAVVLKALLVIAWLLWPRAKSSV